MTLGQSTRTALHALALHKLRTGLTMLGIVIGVAAVVAMLAVGAGAQARIAEQIHSIGSNVIFVAPGSARVGGARLGTGTRLRVTEDDAAAIAREIPAVLLAAPVLRGTAQVVYGNVNWSTTINGTTPEFLELREWPLEGGRVFTREEVAAGMKLAIVGATPAAKLFGAVDAVGQIIRIKKVPFTVIGVQARKGQNPAGLDQDDMITIPLSTARKKVLGRSHAGSRSVSHIQVKVRPDEDLFATQEQIHTLLRQRHKFGPDQDDDFRLNNVSEMLETASESSRIMTHLLAAIAAISLVVGGVGIMNVMLVAVRERTREIGLRMAVGAQSREILLQFLLEAVMLTVIGGAIGIGVGLASSEALGYYFGWPTLVAPDTVGLAFGFAVAVGVLSGFYPACRAARMHPVDALRYE